MKNNTIQTNETNKVGTSHVIVVRNHILNFFPEFTRYLLQAINDFINNSFRGVANIFQMLRKLKLKA